MILLGAFHDHGNWFSNNFPLRNTIKEMPMGPLYVLKDTNIELIIINEDNINKWIERSLIAHCVVVQTY